jgi:hypothetical protein
LAACRPRPSSASPRRDGIFTVVGVPWYFTTSVTGLSATTGAATVSFSLPASAAAVTPSTVALSTVRPMKSRVISAASATGRTRRVAVPVSTLSAGDQSSSRP